MGKEIVIITGASGNIGRTIAEKYYKEGYEIVLLYRSNHRVLNNFDCKKYSGDICDKNFIKNVLSEIDFAKRFINVNCFGNTIDKLTPRLSEEEFLSVIDVNLKGVFYISREISKLAKNGGHIINLSSISGIQGRIGQTAYSAAKGGLISFTKSFSKEMGRKNIQANVVLPGFIPSKITGKLSEGKIEEIKGTHFLHRLQSVEETVFFIYSLSKMKNVNGQVFNLDSRIF